MTTFQTPRPGERMIAVEEAQERVLAEVTALDAEDAAFGEAHGRVLREDIRATYDVPGSASRRDSIVRASAAGKLRRSPQHVSLPV